MFLAEDGFTAEGYIEMTENPASLLPQVISIMPFYDEKNLGGLSTFIIIP